MQPTDWAVPKISLTPPARSFDSDLYFIVRAISMISSSAMLPECLIFFSFLRSRGGSAGHNFPTGKRIKISRRTLERPDDEGRSGRYDRDLGLTVLDGELYGDA